MAATYEPIASTTLGSNAGSITFTSGGSFANYTDLVAVGFVQCNFAATSWGYVRFNGDSGSNYSATWLYGDGTAAASARHSNYSYIRAGDHPQPSETPAPHIFHFFNVNNTNVYKTVLSESANPYRRVTRDVGLWRNTAAITSITIGNNYGFLAGTTISLFGIKASA